ncbi:MAG: efflux RND transporter periplasmic adaptor subunit [Prolixibacteraceae bacterium]
MKNKKRLLIAGLILSALVVFYIVFKLFGITSSFNSNPDNYTTTIVDRGQVYLPIEASGVVEPENEVLILSPLTSIIKKINTEPGSRIGRGDVILELDDEPTRNEIEQISDQLEVKSNSLERSKLDGQISRIDLDYNVEVKKLRIASIKAQLADEEQLLLVGGISSAKIDETKQNLVLAEKDLDMIQKKNTIRLKQLKTEEAGLNLQIEIQKKQLADKIEMLGRLKIKAPSNGIILTISGKEGEKVGIDKMLITLSDLTTFKIKGMIDEKSSDFIKTGNRVFVLIDNEKLNGTIGNITPTVADNKIQFNVHLENNSNPKLIPNQTVKLQVLKSAKDLVLRIPFNPKFRANTEQLIYVIDSGKVVERKVKFGMSGSDYQEVISGLKEGDRVVLSDSPFSWSGKNKENKN